MIPNSLQGNLIALEGSSSLSKSLLVFMLYLTCMFVQLQFVVTVTMLYPSSTFSILLADAFLYPPSVARSIPLYSTNKSDQKHQQIKSKRIQEKLSRQLDKLQQVQSLGQTPTYASLERLLAISASANRWDTYDLIMDQILQEYNYSHLLTTQTTSYILKECYSVGNGLAALRILQTSFMMERTSFQNNSTSSSLLLSSSSPSKEDLETCILALCRNDRYEPGLWKKALQLIYLASAGIQKGRLSGPLSVEVYNEVLERIMDQQPVVSSEESLQLLHLMEEDEEKEKEGHHQDKVAKESDTRYPETNQWIRKHPLPTLATYQRVFSSLINNGKVEQAVDLILSLPSRRNIYPTIYSYEIIMSELLKKGRKNYWRMALNLLDAMHQQKIAVPTVMYNRVISCCAKSNQHLAAKDVFLKMRDCSVTPDTVTFNTLINSCAEEGDAKGALALFLQAQKEATPDVITYTNTIKACAKSKWSRKAMQLLEDAKQKKNIMLDAYIYTSVIDACAKAKMWNEAFELLDDMKKNKVIPNEYTYSSAITACGNCGKWKKALELFDQMKSNDLKASAVGYNAVISALARGARLQMESNSTTFSGTMDDENDGDHHLDLSVKSVLLLDEMKRFKIRPDIYTFSSVMSCLSSYGKYQEAITLISNMRNGPPRVHPNKIIYTGAISACARAGAYQDASKLFEDMKANDIEPDLVAYNSLMSAFSQGHQPLMAFELWNQMCNMSAKRLNLAPDIITVTSIIASLDRSGTSADIERMDSVFKDAVNMNILFSSSSMDTAWEKDLSGLSFPVARAACRYIFKSLLADKSASVQDLVLITGVGRSQTYSVNIPVATSTLREHVRQVLLNDFQIATPSDASGIICVKSSDIQSWLSHKN